MKCCRDNAHFLSSFLAAKSRRARHPNLILPKAGVQIVDHVIRKQMRSLSQIFIVEIKT